MADTEPAHTSSNELMQRYASVGCFRIFMTNQITTNYANYTRNTEFMKL